MYSKKYHKFSRLLKNIREKVVTNFMLLCTHVSVEYEENPIEHTPLSSADLCNFFKQETFVGLISR